MDIPNPYAEAYLSNLYDRDLHGLEHGKFTKPGTQNIYRHAKRLEKNIASYSQDCEGRKLFRKLMGEGLALCHFGMDFTELYHRRYCPSGAGQCKAIDGHELEKDGDVKRLWDLYYSTTVSSFLNNHDLPEMFRSIFSDTDPYGFTQEEKKLVDAFRRDGFVIIDKWPDLDHSAHFKQAERRLAKYMIEPNSDHSHDLVHNGSMEVIQKREMGHMTTLDSFRDKNSFMMRLASAYLGGEAEAHVSSAFTLKGAASKEMYKYGPYHHDGCGRRLKAWIYHDDVTMNQHPTLIAQGTQHFQWYESTHHFVGQEGLNKLNEDVVEKEFGERIKPMLAKKGGGFIFDTNTIHGALMKGIHYDRKTTLVEVSTKEHMTMPRSRSSDDAYLSGFNPGYCPGTGDR